jgi:hypothetical protein
MSTVSLGWPSFWRFSALAPISCKGNKRVYNMIVGRPLLIFSLQNPKTRDCDLRFVL